VTISKFVVEWCAEHIFPWAGKVTLLHAYSFAPVTFIPGPSLAYSADAIEKSNKAFEQAAIRKGSELLKNYAKESAKLGRKPEELKLIQSEPYLSIKAAILDFTENTKPDFLVCGSRGMGTMGRMLIGSVSDYLMHNCKCSVLIVKEREPKCPKMA